jgi:uncharacterized protein
MNETKKPRGFAALSPERVREIARMGGKQAQATGRAHKWTAETASAAGRKGGLTAYARKLAKKLAEECGSDGVSPDVT